MNKLVKEYYRVNPFEGNFSTFVKTLANDPELLDKQLVQKTDTGNYFLKGFYKVFNPFGFNAEKIEMIFAEQEQELVAKNQQTIYTTYSYQLLAYFDDTEINRRLILNDYNKIKKRLRREMKNETISLKGVKDIEDGEIINYYFDYSLVYPVTVSWQTLGRSKKLALTIITRLAVANNRAYPPGGIIIRTISPQISNFNIDSF